MEHIAATEVTNIEDTVRAGWRVQGVGTGGPFVFEQQVYSRERDGQVAWLRVMCTARAPLGADARPEAQRSTLARTFISTNQFENAKHSRWWGRS